MDAGDLGVDIVEHDLEHVHTGGLEKVQLCLQGRLPVADPQAKVLEKGGGHAPGVALPG